MLAVSRQLQSNTFGMWHYAGQNLMKDHIVLFS